jgi:endonuclease/exonuclease/phosphatase family metal-dependent hydrolase
MIRASSLSRIALLTVVAASSALSQDTLTVMTYNLLNYVMPDTSRDQYYRTTVEYVHPDILVVQEMTSQAAVDNFLTNVLNAVYPGEYQKSTFVDGTDTDNELYYRTGKIGFIANSPIPTDLRDISRFTIYHPALLDTLRIFSVHLKASSGSTNEAQRASEADNLLTVVGLLPQGADYMVVGDFNIYASTEAAYQKLRTAFDDVIAMSGVWNNPAYAPYHTQSPRVRAFGGGATGGLDDRFDLMLMSPSMNGGGGNVTYLPGTMAAVGNDGNHYNDSINRLPNNAVPAPVANALHYAADHLPVMGKFVFRQNIPPFQLASFTASPTQDNEVMVEWSTASEFNTLGFEIQRRSSAPLAKFQPLPNSFTPGHGTTQEMNHYSYIDSTVSAGTWYYRIEQIDIDSTSFYSAPVQIDFVTAVASARPGPGFALFQNYPNPFNPSTQIEYTIGGVRDQGSGVSLVRLGVYDLLGREVATLVNEPQAPGKYRVQFDGSRLASGVYLCKLEWGGHIATQKLSIIK